MNAYVDTSVVLRLAFGEPDELASWGSIERAISSELLRVEALRALDRARVLKRLSDEIVAYRRAAILASLERLELVSLEPPILARACEAFPTSLGTLDALHLATALAIREEIDDLVLATHDAALGLGARAMGFPVEGVAVFG